MKQTVKVSVADIRSFKKNSSHIQNKGVLPILDYIKFDNGTITKTNLNEFVIQESAFIGSFLIEERILFSFIDYTSALDIIFVTDGKRVILSDGSQKAASTQGDMALFPIPEEMPKESVSLTDTILKHFGSAAKYTQEGNDDLRKTHVLRTRQGHEARFIAHLDGGQPAPLVIEIVKKVAGISAIETLENYYLNGKYGIVDSPLDLFMEY